MSDELARWQERWRSGETGWHRSEVHPLLVEHAESTWNRVLVPLCGATLDLGWLADRGIETVGVEISQVAAERVFEERSVTPEITGEDQFTFLSSGLLTVAVADVFDLEPDNVGTFDAVWDRASLVAIAPEQRARYIATLRRVAPGADLLLVVLDYDDDVMDGPPHAVTPEEVRDLIGGAELVLEEDVSEEFRARGRDGWIVQRLYRARL